MKTGICVYGNIEVEKLAAYLRKYGIERTFVLSDIENFDETMQIFKENGIICETLHAPFVGINAMWGNDEKAAAEMLARLKDSVDKCEKYNVPISVVHLSSGCPMPEITEGGLKRYEELFDYAEKKGVKIALENQRYAENLSFFMEHYKSVGFCWDAGHECGFTKGIRFMELFGDRAIALHIHDNACGVNTDDHLLPFDGNIDFEVIAKNIADSGYNGTLMLELIRNAKFMGKAIYNNLSDEEYIKRAAQAANKLAQMVETKKRTSI